MTGKFIPRKWGKVGEAIQLNDVQDNISHAYEVIREQKTKLICINDSDIYYFDKTKDRINDALKKILPEKSRFEK